MEGERHRRLREALGESDVFGSLTEDELERLVAYGNLVRHAKGHVIFQKGEPGDSLMIVLSGRVKISNYTADGRETLLNFIEPGRSFGEIALLDGKPRSADASAQDACELFVLRRGDVHSFLERHPDIAFRIIGILCDRLRRTTEMVEDAGRNMKPRIAKGLIRLANGYGRRCPEGIRIELKLSQRELGNYIGLARENVNRQLNDWRKDGLLSLDDGFIVVHDLKVLSRIAASSE
ncbi:MAG: Crp/Fnr family transcriptional regulator [Geminicoccaceae bacterium]